MGLIKGATEKYKQKPKKMWSHYLTYSPDGIKIRPLWNVYDYIEFFSDIQQLFLTFLCVCYDHVKDMVGNGVPLLNCEC